MWASGSAVSFAKRRIRKESHNSAEFVARRSVALSPFACYSLLFADALFGLGMYWLRPTVDFWLALLLLFPLYGALWLVSRVNEEKLTVIHGLGVELKQHLAFGIVKTKFLGDASINAIILHESIRGSGVWYALAFAVQGEKRLTLCFEHVYPGLTNLHTVYREAARSNKKLVSSFTNKDRK